MSGETVKSKDVKRKSMVAQLTQAVESLDTEDLSGLAKMHSHCETLAEASGPKSQRPCPGVHEQVTKLAQALESLILGDAEDLAATAASIRSLTAGLGEVYSPTPETSPSNSEACAKNDSAAPSRAEASDGEVAAQLDRIFEGDGAETSVEACNVERESAAETAGAAESSPAGQSPSGESPESAADSEPPYEQEPLKIDEKELEFIKGFVEEASEHIEAVEGGLLEVEQSAGDSAKIDDLFRPFHTIKGMAGFLNLRDVNCLTHEAETLLDQCRKGKREMTSGLIDLIFDVVDILKAQIAPISGYVADPNGGAVPQPPVAEMIGKLRDVVAGRIEPEGGRSSQEGPPEKVGEHLVDQKACPKEVVAFALENQKKEKRGQGQKAGEILVEMGAATPRQVDQALRAQSAARSGGTAAPASSVPGDQSVRIDTAKLDALVDMVGELVIAQTLVGASDLVSGDPRLTKDVSQVDKIVRDVQEVAMAMRMIPVGSTFHKMARLVRDVSRKAGKRVELHISGEETELDKNVIQQINDPLVHMVRNAVDHGVESPEERAAAGKDAVGHVYLSAFHYGGNIVIEIRDDGKGLNPEKLVAKAVERGVIQAGDELTDQQAYGLIFAPGFSMAAKVTDISGRGVGMDVVRRNIEQLRGKVEIDSELGKGSRFSIRLPLTLAIIDGMVVAIGGERFIIPTIAIEQALRPVPEQITSVQRRGEVIMIRGRLIPLIQLGELFGLTSRVEPHKAMVVIAYHDDRQVGLVVEKLLGQQQVVIKSLGHRFEKLRGISGAAILGDGRVGLILGVSGLASAYADWRAGADRVAPHQNASCESENEDEGDDESSVHVRPVSNRSLNTDEQVLVPG